MYCWRSLTLIIVIFGRLHPCPPCKSRQTHLDLLYKSLKTEEWHFTNFNRINSLIFQHWQKTICLDYNTLPSSQAERWRERGFCVVCNPCTLFFKLCILVFCHRKRKCSSVHFSKMIEVTLSFNSPQEPSDKGRQGNKLRLSWMLIHCDVLLRIVYPWSHTQFVRRARGS